MNEPQAVLALIILFTVTSFLCLVRMGVMEE